MQNNIQDEINRLETKKRLELLKREVFELGLENEAIGAKLEKEQSTSLIEKIDNFYSMCSTVYFLKTKSGWTLDTIAAEMQTTLPVVRGAWIYANKYLIRKDVAVENSLEV